MHEDVKLQSELRNALDVMIDEHENVEIPSQSDIKSMGYVEVGESKNFKKYTCWSIEWESNFILRLINSD